MKLEKAAANIAYDVIRYKLKGKLSAFEEEMAQLIADQAKALKEQDDWLIEMANDNTVDNMKRIKAEQALTKANERVEELEDKCNELCRDKFL